MAKYQELEEPESEYPQRGSLLMLGANGGMGDEEMGARFARQQRFIDRMDYRECIPCSKCCSCLTLRKCLASGEIVTTGYYCNAGEINVSEYHTCNGARRSKNGRVKVLMDTSDAPAWAKFGGDRSGEYETDNSKKYGRLESGTERGGGAVALSVPPTKPTGKDEYIGGSKEGAVKRDEGEGAGDMPRVLVN